MKCEVNLNCMYVVTDYSCNEMRKSILLMAWVVSCPRFLEFSMPHCQFNPYCKGKMFRPRSISHEGIPMSIERLSPDKH